MKYMLPNVATSLARSPLQFGSRADLIKTAERAVPSTVAIFKAGHPNLSSLSRYEIESLVRREQLPPSISSSELEQTLSVKRSSSAATWIDTNRGPMILGCRHNIPDKTIKDVRLSTGQIVPKGPATFEAQTNPIRLGELVIPQWKLRLADSHSPWNSYVGYKRRTVTDPVNDLAVWEAIDGPTPPSTVSLADSNPFSGQAIVRIGAYGRIIPGEFKRTKTGTDRWRQEFDTEPQVTWDDLNTSRRAIVTGETFHGDSGGAMLDENGNLFSITSGFEGYNGQAQYNPNTGKTTFYNPKGLAGSGANGPDISMIRRFLERHGLL